MLNLNKPQSLRLFLKRLGRNAENTLSYIKFAIEGNQVEKVSDLYRCKKPLLLLHGFGATRRVFQVLENRLRQDGYNIFTIHLGGIFDTFNTKGIDANASFIASKVERIYKKYRIQGKLTIIGHSKGGLIGRYYIKKFGGEKFANSLITLGTPHNGSPWAILGFITPLGLWAKSMLQMTPWSNFIKELNNTKWPAGVKIVSIFSKDDHFAIYPSPVLNTHHNPNLHNMELDYQGHTDFLISKVSYQAIRDALRLPIRPAKRSQTRPPKQKQSPSNKSK